MVAELDEPLLEVNQPDLLADIVNEAERYLAEMTQGDLGAGELAFSERLSAHIAEARAKLPAVSEEEPETQER